MATAADLQEIVKTLKSNLKQIAAIAIQDTETEFIKLNVEQLESGFDSKKKRLRKYRSPQYAQLKNQQNALPGLGNPDLILTGAFTGSFNLNVAAENYTIFATDYKANDLTKKYGDDIFGLGETQNEYYSQNVVFPVMMETITTMTGL